MKKIIASLFLLLCVFGSPVIEIDSGNLKITNLDRLIFTKNGEFTI